MEGQLMRQKNNNRVKIFLNRGHVLQQTIATIDGAVFVLLAHCPSYTKACFCGCGGHRVFTDDTNSPFKKSQESGELAS
jgi:hypothetical protein